ncbi:MAG: DNA-processing protein DprA [Pseudoxanthomonas sp.]
MDDTDPSDALLALVLAGGPGAPRRALLERHPSAAAALHAGVAGGSTAGLDATTRARLRRPCGERLARCRDWLAQPGRHLLGWRDPDYPPLLRAIASPPLALFVDGDPAWLWHPAVAVVGSRNPSVGGGDNARVFATALAACGLVVASGMAAGIDACAHQAALDAGAATIAVVGTGPDLAYPTRHAPLRARIATHGAVVSEHPPGTGARAAHFPARNRLLAGLALGTLVVEAAHRSGALITARLAAEAGREVMALPGSIHNPLARGCHRLIRDGALLVESPQEVVEALAPAAQALGRQLRLRLGEQAPAAAAPDPENQAGRVWRALGHEPADLDQLAARTGLDVAALAPALLQLELDGRIAREHGRYQRRS